MYVYACFNMYGNNSEFSVFKGSMFTRQVTEANAFF